MKLNKAIRKLSREMLRASFTDGQLDSGRIASLVDSLIAENGAITSTSLKITGVCSGSN